MKLPGIVALLLLALPLQLPAMPRSDLALCTRSATLLACQDSKGNYYSVRTEGSTFYLRGYEAASKRLWAQTNSRYGGLTFFSGLASDGEAWVGYSQRIGWTTRNRVSSSSGERFNLHCSLIGGCR
ncbi:MULTISPECIES: glutamine synthetase [unclassified Pseudomonas]|uniref:glutamine synthetase n=1 Tax=unclassified Pseudomonas TaxID=196821 RepID=UPI002096EAE3|nr:MULTISPECIES: glutamine synthetase [unclassified Pseudomonas]MCO7518643.1 glutamine synthetase [Pseudomonas sp. 1]MCO7539129.1 glutamine synthetase [Pseudomonas sp. VA159-2]